MVGEKKGNGEREKVTYKMEGKGEKVAVNPGGGRRNAAGWGNERRRGKRWEREGRGAE